MGRAVRWFKVIFGGTRKEKEKEKEGNSSCSRSVSGEKSDKRRWSIGKSIKDERVAVKAQGSRPGSAADPRWLRSYIKETEKERSKHAIAVAAATAAAADAAVAAAQAAVAVVRLTSQGRGALLVGGGREWWAAASIQAVFRGYLARKALRALKGLVKLQALVRGYLVRKRAAAMLHSMQALIRAQTAARCRRAQCSVNKENKLHAENWPRRSTERFDDSGSDFHRKRISTSYDPPPTVANGFDESPKIVEIDTYKPSSRSRRMSSNMLVERGDDYLYHAVSSPLPCPVPARLSIPECRYLHDPDWWFIGDERKFSTAHNTPRFAGSGRHHAPVTPAKSVCGDAFFRPYSNNHPNYMANTQSFNVKMRLHSAPKQRPEPGFKKRLSLNEIMASRISVSGVRMQRNGRVPTHKK